MDSTSSRMSEGGAPRGGSPWHARRIADALDREISAYQMGFVRDEVAVRSAQGLGRRHLGILRIGDERSTSGENRDWWRASDELLLFLFAGLLLVRSQQPHPSLRFSPLPLHASSSHVPSPFYESHHDCLRVPLCPRPCRRRPKCSPHRAHQSVTRDIPCARCTCCD